MKQHEKLGVGWGRWVRLDLALDDMGNESGTCDMCDAPIGWQDDGDRYVNGWWRLNPNTKAELFACRLCALEATVLMLREETPTPVTADDMTTDGMRVDLTLMQLRAAKRAMQGALAWGPRDPHMVVAVDTIDALLEHAGRMHYPAYLTITVRPDSPTYSVEA